MTAIIPKGRGRLIVADHPDSLYITTQLDGAGVALFIDDPEELKKLCEAVFRAWRRVKRRHSPL
jgi:hypothetical protein